MLKNTITDVLAGFLNTLLFGYFNMKAFAVAEHFGVSIQLLMNFHCQLKSGNAKKIPTILCFRVPWLIPILKADEVADDIVDAVREDQEMLVLPKFLGKLLAIKR